MDFPTLTLGILTHMLERSGVNDWGAAESQENRLNLTAAACEMAEAILLYESELDMAKEIYINEATAIVVSGAVGADYAWSVEGTANGKGRVSAVIDLGAAPRTCTYRWRCNVAFQATPTAGNDLRLRKAESDGTDVDAGTGTADAEIAAEPTYNCKQFGAVKVQAAGTQDNISGGIVEIYERYVVLVAWNASGATANATDTEFHFTLTPIYDQQQT